MPGSKAPSEEVAAWAEEAVADSFQDLNLTPEPAIVAEVAAQVAADVTPTEAYQAGDATRVIASDIAAVLSKHGRPVDADALEAFLAGRGPDTPVFADGEQSPDEVERRHREAAAAAQRILSARTNNAKKLAVYEAIKASPPYMYYNREARVVSINGYPIPIPAGRIEPKQPGTAGIGCLYVARLVGEWEDFRLIEQRERERLKEQILHGEDYDVEVQPAVAGRGWSQILPPPM